MTGGIYGEGGGKPPDKGRTNIGIVDITHDDNDMMDINNTINNSNLSLFEHDNSARNNPGEKKISDRVNKIDFDNKYKEDSSGPHTIFVEHKYLNFGKLHPLRISEKLYNLGGDEQYIDYLDIVGRNRVQIFTKSARAANILVKNPVFEQNNLIAYIPLHLTTKKGLIRGVDTSFKEEELKNIIKSEIPVKSVQRRYKNVVDKDGKIIKVPRQQVILTFDRLALPQSVFIYKLRHNVEVWYSPVTQCFNCLRYGHTSKQCKSQKKCKNCGDVLNTGETRCAECKTSCIHCDTNDHNSTSKECPMYLKQKRTKEAMANLNLTFKEAEKLVDHPSYSSLVIKNKFMPLTSSSSEFPSLPVRKNSDFSLSQPTNKVDYPKSLSISQPSTSHMTSYSNKKRKTNDRSPNFDPPRREFDWNYTGSPLFQPNKHMRQEDIAEFKNKIHECLTNKISSSIQSITPPNMESILDNLNLGKIIESTLGELFQKWAQKNKN